MLSRLLNEMRGSSSARIVAMVKKKINVALQQAQVPLNEDEATYLVEIWRQLESHPRTLEVGLGWGFSASCLLAAGSADHTIISYETGPADLAREAAALRNVQIFGRPRVIFGPSDRILPRLVEQGERFGLILIDGNHLFDYTLVDVFYSLKLLVVGGVIMLDDTSYPQIHAVCDFIEKNYSHVQLIARPPNAAVYRKVADQDLRDDCEHFVPFETKRDTG
ncbi:MAG: O-methyltransferase family 3 [Betaproteobacteria bacterium]|nr:O-methyltransferase family 3 [Betaproteobacteria bacterium]